MTTDEKAKAYDMALEGARKELGVDRKEWEVVQQVLHNIFPELRESEDERIRKELIMAFEAYDVESSWNGLPVKSILAWLEKQKTYKPTEEDERKRKMLIETIDSIENFPNKGVAIAYLEKQKPQDTVGSVSVEIRSNLPTDEVVRKTLIMLVNDGRISVKGAITSSDILNWLEGQKEPEVDLEKFTEKMDAWKARYNHPDNIPIKATMAFTARMFYMYPKVAREWYDSLPKVTMD